MIKYFLILSLVIPSTSFGAQTEKDASTQAEGAIKPLTKKRNNRKKHPYSRIDTDYTTDTESSSESEYEIEKDERPKQLKTPKDPESYQKEKQRLAKHNESEKQRRTRLDQERKAILKAQAANSQTLLNALHVSSEEQTLLLAAAVQLSTIDPSSSAVMFRRQDHATHEKLTAEFAQADQLDKTPGRGITHEQQRMLVRGQVITKALTELGKNIQSNRAIAEMLARQVNILASKQSAPSTAIPAQSSAPMAAAKKEPIMFSWQLPRSDDN